MWTADELRSRLGVKTNPGAAEGAILQFERASGLNLPTDLRELLAVANGAVHPKLHFSLSSLDSFSEWDQMGADSSLWRRFGFVPVADFNDSNPYLTCCRGPLAKFVVHFDHDGFTNVAFRSLHEFLSALESAIPEGRAAIDGPLSDFERPERTERDIQIGRELLAMADTFDDEDRVWVCRFGMTLLADLEEIAPWLDDRNEYVRHDVADRLGQFSSPQAQDAIAAQDAKLRDFVAHCAQLLTAAGFGCTIRKEKNLRVVSAPESLCAVAGIPPQLIRRALEIQPIGLNTAMMYGKRTDPAFPAWLIQRVGELACQRVS
jgi:hypothetical protein